MNAKKWLLKQHTTYGLLGNVVIECKVDKLAEMLDDYATLREQEAFEAGQKSVSDPLKNCPHCNSPIQYLPNGRRHHKCVCGYVFYT